MTFESQKSLDTLAEVGGQVDVYVRENGKRLGVAFDWDAEYERRVAARDDVRELLGRLDEPALRALGKAVEGMVA